DGVFLRESCRQEYATVHPNKVKLFYIYVLMPPPCVRVHVLSRSNSSCFLFWLTGSILVCSSENQQPLRIVHYRLMLRASGLSCPTRLHSRNAGYSHRTM